MQQIRATADRMASDARFKVIFNEYPAMIADDISAWEEEIRASMANKGVNIPQSLTEFYGCTGGFKYQWEYLGADEIVTGSCCISTLIELYQRDDEVDLPLAECLRRPRIFDWISPDDQAVIEFDNDSLVDFELSLIESDKKLRHPLGMDIVSYLQNAADYRAIYRWHNAFFGDERDATKQGLQERLKKYLINS